MRYEIPAEITKQCIEFAKKCADDAYGPIQVLKDSGAEEEVRFWELYYTDVMTAGQRGAYAIIKRLHEDPGSLTPRS